MLSAKGAHQERWKDLLQANLASLFELALLLTADPQEAEARLVGALDALDFSKQPDEDALAVLRMAIARQSTGTAGAVFPAGAVEARSMLRAGLLPVLQLKRSSRICFVLRMFFGYATSACAGMLGIDEGGAKTLLRVAILQLHHAYTMPSPRQKQGPAA